jgi:hypothetical protein
MQGLTASRPQRVVLEGKGLVFRGDAGIADFHGRNYARTLMRGPALIFSKAYRGGIRRAKGFRFARCDFGSRVKVLHRKTRIEQRYFKKLKIMQ